MTLQALVRRALEEDAAHNDVTTRITIPPGLKGRFTLLAKQEGVIAGLDVAAAVFRAVDPAVQIVPFIADGARLKKGDVVATVSGAVSSVLRAERTALNFVQRLSGIATETSRYVEAVADTSAVILDTRKTTPGLRALEKHAVTLGGGRNHRMSLADGVLIKDNHIAALRASGAGVAEAVRRAKDGAPPGMKVEVEVGTMDEVRQALDAGADTLLLDNMPLEETREAVQLAKGRALTEASGGVNLSNVRAVAETGVDFISVGALTHSVRALDISLEFEELEGP